MSVTGFGPRSADGSREPFRLNFLRQPPVFDGKG